MNGMAKLGVGLIFAVSLVLVVSVSAQLLPVMSDDFKVQIISEYHGLTNHKVVFEISNLHDVNADFNVEVLFQNTTFNLTKLNDVWIYEWKPLNKTSYNITIENVTNSTCYYPDNTTYECEIPTYSNSTYYQMILGWKPTKMLLVKKPDKVECEYGNVNIPKNSSKCKKDDLGTDYGCAGTKLFKIEWTTPIMKNSGWGSGGYYAIRDKNTGFSYDPWWNTSINYRQPLEINSSWGDLHMGIPVLVNGSDYVDLSGMINDSKLDADAYCLWFVNGSTTSTEVSWHWANYTSTTFGHNTSTAEIWLNGSANATYYMYYDNDCGASSGSWDDTTQTDSSLKAWWHTAEENGKYTNESAQALHNGTLTTVNWESSGKFGEAVDIQNGGCINCGDHADWDTDNFTVEMWVNRTATCAGDFPGVYSKGGNQYFLSCLVTSNVLRGYIWNGGFQTVSGPAISQNTWIHIAHTYNDSAHCVWTNGVPVCAALATKITTDANPFEIGSYIGCGNNNRDFTGKMDEVTMSDVYRSHAWINFRADGSPSSLGAEESGDVYGPALNYVAPTLANLTTTNANYIEVNVSSNESVSLCLLEWNGANQTMTEGSDWCYRNMTGLTQGNYYFAVWGNDSADNWNISYGREIIYINASAPGGGGGGGVQPPPPKLCGNYSANPTNFSQGGLMGQKLVPFKIDIHNEEKEQKFSAFFTGGLDDHCIFLEYPRNITPVGGVATFTFQCTAPNGTVNGLFVFRTDTKCEDYRAVKIYSLEGFWNDIMLAIAQNDWIRSVHVWGRFAIPFFALVLMIIFAIIVTAMWVIEL